MFSEVPTPGEAIAKEGFGATVSPSGVPGAVGVLGSPGWSTDTGAALSPSRQTRQHPVVFAALFLITRPGPDFQQKLPDSCRK